MATIGEWLRERRLAGPILAAALFGLAAAPAETPAPSFAALVAQAESGDPATDYTALRMAYAASDGYDGYGITVHDLYGQLWPDFQAKRCDKVIATSDKMLKIDYTLATVHFIRSDCFKQTGDSARAGREEAIGRGLAKSLLASGDGTGVDTAFVVVTMAEERFLLTYLDMDEERQALIVKNGHQFDLITGKNRKTGAEQAAYFNVDALFAGMERQLHPKP